MTISVLCVQAVGYLRWHAVVCFHQLSLSRTAVYVSHPTLHCLVGFLLFLWSLCAVDVFLPPGASVIGNVEQACCSWPDVWAECVQSLDGTASVRSHNLLSCCPSHLLFNLAEQMYSLAFRKGQEQGFGMSYYVSCLKSGKILLWLVWIGMIEFIFQELLEESTMTVFCSKMLILFSP